MAITPTYTNPGFATPGAGPAPTLSTPKPQTGPSTQPNMQHQLQTGLPFSPNNGNPAGASNMQRSPYPNSRQAQGLPRNPVTNAQYGAKPLLQPQQMMSQPMQEAPPPMQQDQSSFYQNLMGSNNRDQFLQNPMNQSGGVPQLSAFQGMMQQMLQRAPTGQSNGPGGLPQLQGMLDIYRGGQNPALNRYQPPQMQGGNMQWGNGQQQGPYSYNLPNAFGPYPNFGQGPYGYGNNYGG